MKVENYCTFLCCFIWHFAAHSSFCQDAQEVESLLAQEGFAED